jgi:heme exporter protein A
VQASQPIGRSRASIAAEFRGVTDGRPQRLEAVALTLERGGRRLFSGLEFSVAAGEALVVTGPNGAGKSSLLRVVAGLLSPTEGRVRLVGGDDETPLSAQVHYLGHLDAVKPALSVAEALGFWAVFLGGTQARVDEALETVGLSALADLPSAYLSAGQRRRLALARLVAAPRPLWLLDEPTAALDAAAERRLGEMIREHVSGGGMLMAATHAELPVAAPRRLVLGGSGAA